MGLNGRALADVVKIAERELGLARAGSGNPALLTQEGFWQYLNDICAQVVGMRWDDILSNFDPYLIFPRWPDCALGVGVYG